jgi:hypothetical protein
VPTCDYGVVAALYQAHFARERLLQLAAGGGYDRSQQCRPGGRSLRRIVRLPTAPKINVHSVLAQPDGSGITWVRGEVPASMTSGVTHEITLAVRCVAHFEPAAVGSASGASSAAAPASEDDVCWVMRDVLWTECPCKQKWNCAHAGSVLWVLILWGVARTADHADRARFGVTAQRCWWLGLSQRAVDAHALQSRTTPAWMLDNSRIRFGPAGTADLRSTAAAATRYDPARSDCQYPVRGARSTASLAELFGAIAADNAAAARGGGAAAPTANEHLYGAQGSSTNDE